jgi:hypothetical protein
MIEEENVNKPNVSTFSNKKTTPQKTVKRKTKRKASTKTKRKAPIKRPFPKETVLKALQIAEKIKELNGGKPWPSKEIAKAVGIGSTSNKFYYLTAAARDYGLTVGSSKTEKIEIAKLGKEILYAPDSQTEKNKKTEAFLKIPIFKTVLEHYKGSNLPEMKYLGNTLEKDFKLATVYHEDFSKLFRENCQELEITSGEQLGENVDSSKKPTTLIVGDPPKGSKFKLFVIMPFSEKSDNRPKGFFDEVLRSLITPAGIDAKFSVETANKQGSDVIQSTIINDLLEADLVLADLTDHNPNVLFELGVRMAMDKPVVLIKASETGRIFDIDNMLRVYEYNSNLWQSTVETDLEKLTEHINGAWGNRKSEQTYMKILKRGLQNSK